MDRGQAGAAADQRLRAGDLLPDVPPGSRSGKYHFKVCRTLSCALGGSYELHEHFCEKLGLDPHAHGPQTTKDGKFTVEFVECLASCGTAPVMMCNDAFHEGVSEAKADEILEECK